MTADHFTEGAYAGTSPGPGRRSFRNRMRRRSSSSGVRFDRLPLDFSARSRTSRRSSGESRFQYFRPSVFNHRIAARTLRHGTVRTAVIACKTHAGIGVVWLPRAWNE